MRDLPSGTVTFLFTDIEGSTRLLHDLGAEGYEQALAEHRRLLRAAFVTHEGVEVDTQGDAFFVAFPTAPGALEAAAEGTQGLAAGPIRVRMGIHTGTPLLGEEGYVGVDVQRAARIAACGHGGQVLVSASTAALTGTDGLRDLGRAPAQGPCPPSSASTSWARASSRRSRASTAPTCPSRRHRSWVGSTSSPRYSPYWRARACSP